MKENPNVLVFGAGAVGSTVGGWLAERYPNVWLLDMPAVADPLREKGLTLYMGGEKERAINVKVQAISNMADAPAPDLVVLAVKTYSLDKVAGLVKDKLGDPLILALQNGVDNQTILPKYLLRSFTAFVSYNAWIDAPGVIGYQKKGPLVLGTPDGKWAAESGAVAALLNRGVETVVADRFSDAAYSKMVINLTNSLQALIGHPIKPIGDRALFQKILPNLTWEGVQIVKAAGHRECRLGGMPSWSLMWAAANLPAFITRGPFEKNVKKMVISSMAQDGLQRGAAQPADTELETINGHFIRLADEHKLAVPYNRAVYAMCKERFGKPDFKPGGIEDVWQEVQKRL